MQIGKEEQLDFQKVKNQKEVQGATGEKKQIDSQFISSAMISANKPSFDVLFRLQKEPLSS